MKTSKTWHWASATPSDGQRTKYLYTQNRCLSHIEYSECGGQCPVICYTGTKQPIHNGPCSLPLSGPVGSETDSTDASLTSHTNQAPTSERQRQVEIEPTLRPLDNTWWRNVWGTDCNIKMCPDYVSRMNSTQSTSLTCASLHTMCIRNVKHNVGRRYYV